MLGMMVELTLEISLIRNYVMSLPAPGPRKIQYVCTRAPGN